MDKVIPITGKVDPEVQADRDKAIELARQVVVGEVETVPFVIADHLKSPEAVVAYVNEIDIKTGDLPTMEAMLLSALAAVRRLQGKDEAVLLPRAATNKIAVAIECETDSQLVASGMSSDLFHRQDGNDVWEAAINAALGEAKS